MTDNVAADIVQKALEDSPVRDDARLVARIAVAALADSAEFAEVVLQGFANDAALQLVHCSDPAGERIPLISVLEYAVAAVRASLRGEE